MVLWGLPHFQARPGRKMIWFYDFWALAAGDQTSKILLGSRLVSCCQLWLREGCRWPWLFVATGSWETCLKSRISLPAIPQPAHPRVWYTALLLINRFLHKRIQICFRRQADDPTIRSKSKCCWVRGWGSPGPHRTGNPCDYRLITVVLSKPQSGGMAFWRRQFWSHGALPGEVLKINPDWADIWEIFYFFGHPPVHAFKPGERSRYSRNLKPWDLADASL